jgi:hypothetical protein
MNTVLSAFRHAGTSVSSVETHAARAWREQLALKFGSEATQARQRHGGFADTRSKTNRNAAIVILGKIFNGHNT